MEIDNSLHDFLIQSKSKLALKLKVSESYLKCAKDDIKASKLLYNNKIFNLSVYHLQQAIEKIGKSFLLVTSPEPIKKIKEINHKSPLVFVKILKNYNFIINIVNKLKLPVGTDISKLEEIINTRYQEVAIWKSEQIKELITITNNFTQSFLKNSENLSQSLKIILNLFPQKNINIHNILKIIANLFVLYPLSVITFPHWMSTRYPNQNLSPENYKEGLGIVDCLNELIILSENLSSSLESYLEILKSLNNGEHLDENS